MKASLLKARISAIRNSSIMEQEKNYLIARLRQIIEANRQMIEVMAK